MDRTSADLATSRARARARLRQQRWQWGLLGLLATAALALLVVSVNMRVGYALFSMAGLGLALLVLGLTFVLAADLWGRREADLETVKVGVGRDHLQSAEALNLLGLAALGLVWTVFGVEAAWGVAAGEDGLGEGYRAMSSLVIPAAVMSVILGRKQSGRRPGALPKPADELTIYFRRDALVWAVTATLIAAAVLFVVGLFQPPLAVASMPALFEVAALTAALRYWWLDRQASRG